jgi:PEP-CTERM motif
MKTKPKETKPITTGVNNISKILTVLTCVLLCAGSAAHATDIFDNLNNGNNGFRGVSTTQWLGQSFMSDTTDLLLNSATFNLTSSGGAGTFFVDLYSNTAGKPGLVLATLVTSTDPGSGHVTFSNLNQTLAPNTTYWIVLGENSSSHLALGWGVTADTSGTGSGFQTLNATSQDSGTTWSTTTSAPYQMQLIASAVPEPSSAVCLVLGGFAVLALTLRRRSSR